MSDQPFPHMDFKYNKNTSIPVAFELQMDINNNNVQSNFHNDEGEQFKHLQMNTDYIDTTSNNNNNQSKIDNVKDSAYFQNTDTIIVKTPPRTIIIP
jgi:hypothetical protein